MKLKGWNWNWRQRGEGGGGGGVMKTTEDHFF